MEFKILITMVCLAIIGGISKAMMNTLSQHYHRSIFYNKKMFKVTWWNPKKSWKNKFKYDSITQPKFFGSTTIFTLFTSAWDLFQWIFMFTYTLAILLSLLLSNMPFICAILIAVGYVGILFGVKWFITNYVLISKKS